MLEAANQSWSFVEAAHLLRRAGFSGTIAEVKELHARGRLGAIEYLVDSAFSEELPALPAWAELDNAQKEAQSVAEKRNFLQNRARREGPESEAQENLREFRSELRQMRRQRASEGLAWWFSLMCKPETALREQMVLFWHDHFATNIRKVGYPALMLQQNQRFRQGAVGDFRQLVQEMMVDPALVHYLDLQRSTQAHPNENFARELLELFALGEGQYEEADILELARALTGITLVNHRLEVGFDPKRHDSGRKRIFGRAKNYSPEEAVDWVLEQPAVAEFLVGKLWNWFAGIELPAEPRKQLARSFRDQHEYQLAPFLKQLFGLKAFYHPAVMRQQIKGPVHFLASFCRQFQLPEIPRAYLIGSLSKLRQVPFLPPNVAGWEGGRTWVNVDSLLARYNMVGEFMRPAWRGPSMRGRLGNVFALGRQDEAMKSWPGPDWQQVLPLEERKDLPLMLDRLMFILYGQRLEEGKVAALLEFLEQAAAGQADEVPSDESLRELCELLCCTPQYQLA